jgi:hypothetical protein
MTKILKIFYYLSLGIYVLGVIINIIDNKFDIYQAWGLLTLGAGAYLIEKK